MNENELEQNARNALLGHYSSRSANQVLVILTMVVAFLAFLQVFTFAEWKWLYVLFLGPATFYMVIRGFQRLIVWAKLCDYIGVIRIMEPEKANKTIERARNDLSIKKALAEANSEAKKSNYDVDIQIDQSLLWRIELPCQFYAHACRRAGRFSRWFFLILETHRGYKIIFYLVYIAIMLVLHMPFGIW